MVSRLLLRLLYHIEDRQKSMADMCRALAKLPCNFLLRRPDIDFCFGGKQSVEEIYAACERSGGQWGIDAIAQMSRCFCKRW